MLGNLDWEDLRYLTFGFLTSMFKDEKKDNRSSFTEYCIPEFINLFGDIIEIEPSIDSLKAVLMVGIITHHTTIGSRKV